MINEVSVSNFRCFREQQTVRLAPLTLLVGENSTGKTSFMALVRALWGLAYQSIVPDFKAPPYDLGSFDEIAHHRGASGGRASEFYAGFQAPTIRRSLRATPSARKPRRFEFGVTFSKRGTAPFPITLKLSNGATWVERRIQDKDIVQRFGTRRGAWETTYARSFPGTTIDRSRFIVSFDSPHLLHRILEENNINFIEGTAPPSEKDIDEIWKLYRTLRTPFPRTSQIFASAPVRSVPRRTYDPAPAETDPQGEYVPMYLANMFSEEIEQWKELKTLLERFGKAAGLFDEIHIRRLGKRDSEPFQVQVRKFSGRLKGPRRNLIDVGYGVSQSLPLITELMRRNRPPMFLLQQPEVHLHPSAQAALGTLLCEVAEPRRQLLVETHSDHILDRVRMDVRDGSTALKPEDVSILFFERNELDVHIHSLRLDKHGNVLDAPSTYRSFFLEETSRSLGI